MRKPNANGDSIIGSLPARAESSPKIEYGHVTASENKLYPCCFMYANSLCNYHNWFCVLDGGRVVGGTARLVSLLVCNCCSVGLPLGAGSTGI